MKHAYSKDSREISTHSFWSLLNYVQYFAGLRRPTPRKNTHALSYLPSSDKSVRFFLLLSNDVKVCHSPRRSFKYLPSLIAVLLFSLWTTSGDIFERLEKVSCWSTGEEWGLLVKILRGPTAAQAASDASVWGLLWKRRNERGRFCSCPR